MDSDDFILQRESKRENEQLQQENEELRRENEKLRQENAKLQFADKQAVQEKLESTTKRKTAMEPVKEVNE